MVSDKCPLKAFNNPLALSKHVKAAVLINPDFDGVV